MADITEIATTLGREATTKVRQFVATNETAKKAKDAVYTVVGLGVLGAQKINVAAKAVQQKVDSAVDTDGLKAAVERNADDITTSMKRQAAKADAKVNEVIAMAEAIVAPYEEKLPAPAREASAKVREFATNVRHKVTAALQTEEVVTETAETTTAAAADPVAESTPTA